LSTNVHGYLQKVLWSELLFDFTWYCLYTSNNLAQF
jgi:hypothetical protein